MKNSAQTAKEMGKKVLKEKTKQSDALRQAAALGTAAKGALSVQIIGTEIPLRTVTRATRGKRRNLRKRAQRFQHRTGNQTFSQIRCRALGKRHAIGGEAQMDDLGELPAHGERFDASGFSLTQSFASLELGGPIEKKAFASGVSGIVGPIIWGFYART